MDEIYWEQLIISSFKIVRCILTDLELLWQNCVHYKQQVEA